MSYISFSLIASTLTGKQVRRVLLLGFLLTFPCQDASDGAEFKTTMNGFPISFNSRIT